MNVVAIVMDTFRADIIGAGKKLSFVQTPNLDRLAAESIVFDNEVFDRARNPSRIYRPARQAR